MTVCCLPTSSVFSQWHVLVFFYRSGSPMFSHISVFSVVQVEKILLTFVQVNFLNSLRFAVCFLQDCPVFSPINIFSGEIFQTFQCLSCVFQYRLAKFPQRAKLASSLVGSLLPAKRSPNYTVKFPSACPVFSSTDWQNSHNWLLSKLAGKVLPAKRSPNRPTCSHAH